MSDKRGSITATDDNPSGINQYTGGGAKGGGSKGGGSKGGGSKSSREPAFNAKTSATAARSMAKKAEAASLKDHTRLPNSERRAEAHQASLHATEATRKADQMGTREAHIAAMKEHMYASGIHALYNQTASNRHSEAANHHASTAVAIEHNISHPKAK